MSADNKLQDIIQTSLESIRTVVDANTIIGNPINTPQGTTIIPVSKVSVGFATGGMDFNGKQPQPGKAQNFGGGGGTGMSVSPVGFLIVDKDGSVTMLNVGEGAEEKDPIGQIADVIERSPDIINKIKSFFSSKKKKKDESAGETAETPDEAEAGETVTGTSGNAAAD